MASSLLDQQLSLVSIVVLFSVVTALRNIPSFFQPQQEDDGSIDVATRGTEVTEREGCISCLRSVRIVRAPPALPLPITTPPSRSSRFIISNIIHNITQIFFPSVQTVRAPTVLPQSITTPPSRSSNIISNTLHLVTETVYAIIQSIPSTFFDSSTDDTQSDHHTRRGVYSSDGLTPHGLGDRNLNVVIDSSLRPSDFNGGDT
ncbi:hypothetical protein EDD18DRAFT_1465550 [Armillaria luteobubalina]|uniref:Uncharacterized protein n=1 Tax=Armillaria luteobubalina TaxID=153913 RepID=A0AA39PYH8_9AGAR|nr:hypothetical protein EDD18DRAFT_1465550 [Armillaria luteobubalina]